MSSAQIIQGDCVQVMAEMEAESVDALVTDPPAGISFMNKSWDSNRGSRNAWIAWLTEVMEEAFRVMKPGAHGLVWALPRTSHWTAMALEDAGFEIRDRVTHIHGQGFPKNLDVGKQLDKMGHDQNGWRRFAKAYAEAVEASSYSHSDIDKHLGIKASSCYWVRTDHRGGLPPRQHWERVRGLLNLNGNFEKLYEAAEREVVGKGTSGKRKNPGWGGDFKSGVFRVNDEDYDITAPATEEAKRWQGFGTALKPSTEDWWLIRRPLSEKNVAQNVLRWNCGAINIDATRVDGKRWGTNLLLSHHELCRPTGEIRRVKDAVRVANDQVGQGESLYEGGWADNGKKIRYADPDGYEGVEEYLCVENCPVGLMDEQSGQRKAGGKVKGDEPSRTGQNGIYGHWGRVENKPFDDSGGASRFFPRFPSSLEPEAPFKYAAKASRREREAGLQDVEPQEVQTGCGGDMPIDDNGKERDRFKKVAANTHPTVKPLMLMKWLCRLVCPPGGTILDPFCGSGSTGAAAVQEGFNFIGVDMSEEYAEIARRRIAHWSTPEHLRDNRSASIDKQRTAYGAFNGQPHTACPEHGEPIHNGNRLSYACGCEVQYIRKPDKVLEPIPAQAPEFLETLF